MAPEAAALAAAVLFVATLALAALCLAALAEANRLRALAEHLREELARRDREPRLPGCRPAPYRACGRYSRAGADGRSDGRGRPFCCAVTKEGETDR